MADLLPCMYPGNYLPVQHGRQYGRFNGIKAGRGASGSDSPAGEETGEYNIAILKKLFAGEKWHLSRVLSEFRELS